MHSYIHTYILICAHTVHTCMYVHVWTCSMSHDMCTLLHDIHTCLHIHVVCTYMTWSFTYTFIYLHSYNVKHGTYIHVHTAYYVRSCTYHTFTCMYTHYYIHSQCIRLIMCTFIHTCIRSTCMYICTSNVCTHTYCSTY